MDIVFDGPPGPTSGRFVEVEDAAGKSFNAGEWLQRPDGFWVLRLTQSRLENFALQALKVMEEDMRWDSDTLVAIAEAAYTNGLVAESARFELTAAGRGERSE